MTLLRPRQRVLTAVSPHNANRRALMPSRPVYRRGGREPVWEAIPAHVSVLDLEIVPFDLAAFAHGTIPMTFTALGLPLGLVMSLAGLVTGTPTSAGAGFVVVTATNVFGAADSSQFIWDVGYLLELGIVQNPNNGNLIGVDLNNTNPYGTVVDPGNLPWTLERLTCHTNTALQVMELAEGQPVVGPLYVRDQIVGLNITGAVNDWIGGNSRWEAIDELSRAGRWRDASPTNMLLIITNRSGL